MKRNMVPLVGIAFVVAIISTGVFYGLFAGKLRSSPSEPAGSPIVVAARQLNRGAVIGADDVRISRVNGKIAGSFATPEEVVGATLLQPSAENEPLLEDRLALRTPLPGRSARTVPTGMRAVSIRVWESDGLQSLLQPGAKVDLQAVSDRNGAMELRTIVQNVEVLEASPQSGSNAGNRAVSVLVRAQNADLIALADSGARIRLTIRNPLDEMTSPRGSLALTSVFKADAAERAGRAHEIVEAQPAAHAIEHPIELNVQVFAASAAGLSSLASQLVAAGGENSLRVEPFRAGLDPDELVKALRQKHELEEVATRKLTTSTGRPVSYRASAAPFRLRLRFSTAAARNGKINLRVTPEISMASNGGVTTRQYDVDLAEGASFLVQGLTSELAGQQALERLFPGQSWENRQLAILVTSHTRETGAVASVADTNRGR